MSELTRQRLLNASAAYASAIRGYNLHRHTSSSAWYGERLASKRRALHDLIDEVADELERLRALHVFGMGQYELRDRLDALAAGAGQEDGA